MWVIIIWLLLLWGFSNGIIPNNRYKLFLYYTIIYFFIILVPRYKRKDSLTPYAKKQPMFTKLQYLKLILQYKYDNIFNVIYDREIER